MTRHRPPSGIETPQYRPTSRTCQASWSAQSIKVQRNASLNSKGDGPTTATQA